MSSGTLTTEGLTLHRVPYAKNRRKCLLHSWDMLFYIINLFLPEVIEKGENDDSLSILNTKHTPPSIYFKVLRKKAL